MQQCFLFKQSGLNTMTTHSLETDYLIIGAGAVGMAFADVILSETDANIIIVDKHDKPGGHWNDAYPFVTLHQPSAFYGVSSKELSRGNRDKVGLNKGLHELASGAEVLAYYDQVMKHTFLPSGRIKYFPMCDYKGDGKFESILTSSSYEVTVSKKVVDGTYFKTSVPATHTPNFDIDDHVLFAPLNDLPTNSEPRDGYVIVGGGKTGIDACLWLLEHNIEPDAITWIMPRDAWWIDRLHTQPTRECFQDSIGAQVKQLEAIAQADSIDDLFTRLEEAGVLFRLDKKVKPVMFHGATVSQAEASELRRINNVVRHGRVISIGSDQIKFANTSIPTTTNTLHIDCSARAVPEENIVPVFASDSITLQTVRSFQPVFSAAFIAHIEANYDDESVKNELCAVVPLPNHDIDWLLGTAAQMQNQYRWSQEPELQDWLITNRLDGFSALVKRRDDAPKADLLLLKHMKDTLPAAVANLPKLVGEAMQISMSYTNH